MTDSLQLDITPKNNFKIQYYQKKDGAWNLVHLGDYSKSVADMVYQEVLTKIQKENLERVNYRKKEDGNYALHLGFGRVEIVLHHYDRFLAREDFVPAKKRIDDVRLEQWKYVSKNRALRVKREKMFQRIVTSSAVLLSTIVLANTLSFSGKVSSDKGISREEILDMMIPNTTYQQLLPEEEVLGTEENQDLEDVKTSLIPSFMPSMEYQGYETEKDIISFVSNMYHMTPSQVASAVSRHPEALDEYDNLNVGIMRAAAKDYWDTTVEGINREVEVSSLSSEEKEQLILKIADIYEIKDTEMRATLVAVYRLETESGASNLCVNFNNFGGVRGTDGEYLRYPTPAAGADSLVRSILNLVNRVKENETYDENKTIAQNIGVFYSEQEVLAANANREEENTESEENTQERIPSWSEVVDDVKEKVISQNIPNLVVSNKTIDRDSGKTM